MYWCKYTQDGNPGYISSSDGLPVTSNVYCGSHAVNANVMESIIAITATTNTNFFIDCFPHKYEKNIGKSVHYYYNIIQSITSQYIFEIQLRFIIKC